TAHRKLQLFDRPIQVLVLDFRFALFRASAGFDVLFKVDEDVHVVLQQLRGQTQSIGRDDRSVGPKLNIEFVVIGDLSQTCGFDGVIALAHRRVDGIDGNKSDAKIFVVILVGGNIATAALQAHLHVELAAFADGRDVNVFVEHLDIRIGFDHAGGDHTRLIGAQVDG